MFHQLKVKNYRLEEIRDLLEDYSAGSLYMAQAIARQAKDELQSVGD